MSAGLVSRVLWLNPIASIIPYMTVRKRLDNRTDDRSIASTWAMSLNLTTPGADIIVIIIPYTARRMYAGITPKSTVCII